MPMVQPNPLAMRIMQPWKQPLLGYEATSEDGALWTAATSGIYNEDCRILFGADCDEVTDDIFRPQKPITQAALGLGFTGAIEQDSIWPFVAACRRPNGASKKATRQPKETPASVKCPSRMRTT